MIKCQNFIEKMPNFSSLDDLECADIDTNLDFNIVEHLCKK